MHPSPRSLRGLDWFIFFVADVQTGFGPFVSVYLTGQRWTQFDIGLVQSAAGIVSLLGQMPGGAIVDAARSERVVAGIAIVTICVAALTYAALPIFPVVLTGAVLHALASCVLGPAMAAISLGLVGHAAIGARLGRNARFASVGNGLAAAVMGACGYLLSARAVFIVTVLLLAPALLALRTIAPKEIDPERAHGAVPRRRADKPRTNVAALLRNRPLLIFAGCLLLFHLANGAMLPLMGSVVTMRSSQWATVLIAACIVVPQVVVALLSPSVGTRAQLWGRRPLLLIGFAALPIRGLLFASVSNPWLLVVVQLLDGVTASRVRRHGAAGDRRSDARHRPFQSRPGHRRHRDRRRRFAQRHLRRLHDRPLRLWLGLRRLGRDRAGRPDGAVVADAGDAAGGRAGMTRHAGSTKRQRSTCGVAAGFAPTGADATDDATAPARRR